MAGAGGFMSGFGAAFSRSYENAQDRIQRTKEQDFRFEYDNYLRDKDRRMEWEREDAQIMKGAKMLSSTAANPEQAAIYYEQGLRAGFTPNQLQDIGEDYEIQMTDAPDQTSEAPQTQSTEEANLENQAQKANTPGNPITQALFGGQTRADRKREKHINKIARITGEDPADIKQTMDGGYNSNATSQSPVNFRLIPKTRSIAAQLDDADTLAKSQSAYASAVANGNLELANAFRHKLDTLSELSMEEKAMETPMEPMVVMSYDKNGVLQPRYPVMSNGFVMRKDGKRLPASALSADSILVPQSDVNTFQTAANTMTKDVREQQLALAGMVHNIHELEMMYNNNPSAGSLAAEVLGKVKGAAFEIDSAKAIISDFGGVNELFGAAEEDGAFNENMTLDQQEDTLVSWLNANSSKDEGRGFIRLMQMELAFDFLRMNGQENRAVSVQEFEFANKNMMEGSTPGKIINNLKRVAQARYGKYKITHKAAGDSMAGHSLSGTYPWNEDPSERFVRSLGPEMFKEYLDGSYAIEGESNAPTTVTGEVEEGAPQEGAPSRVGEQIDDFEEFKTVTLRNARIAIAGGYPLEEMHKRLIKLGIDPEEL